MSATAFTHAPRLAAARNGLFFNFLVMMFLALCLCPTQAAVADEVDDVESAVVKMAAKLEKDGFEFRADIWERPLAPDLGKAVRVQFFKGNEYRVCVAVPPDSGVQIIAHVLDTEGKQIESKSEATEGNWGVTLHVKPKRTGVFVVVVARSGGKEKSTVCAMINGYK